MKRLISILLALAVLFALILCVHAAENPVTDHANVLTDPQEKALEKKLASFSEREDFDVVILTTLYIDQPDILEYAEDFYEAGSYRDDGIVFVALIEDVPRYGYVVFGSGNKIFDDPAMDQLDEAFVVPYKSGNFDEAFNAFAGEVDQIVSSYGSISGTTVVLSILIGAVLAWLIPMSILKGQLKTVRRQAAAESYVRRDSMVLTQERDMFLYRNITRTAKPKNTSSGSGGTRTTSGGNRGRSG